MVHNVFYASINPERFSFALLAQLVRARRSHRRGQRFEPSKAHPHGFEVINWAHSKVVLRGIRIAEARVRFPMSPPNRKNTNCLVFFRACGRRSDVFFAKQRQKPRAGVARFFRQEKYL